MDISVYPALFCGEHPYHKTKWGIDFWGHDTGKLSIIKEIGNAVLIREAGQNHWSGRGETTYENPRYYIGLYAEGREHSMKLGNVVFTVYSIQYTKGEQKAVKELALFLLKSLVEA